MNTVRFGVIGVGNIGTAHAACLAAGKIEGAALAAVCDTDPSRRAFAGTAEAIISDSCKVLTIGCFSRSSAIRRAIL